MCKKTKVRHCVLVVVGVLLNCRLVAGFSEGTVEACPGRTEAAFGQTQQVPLDRTEVRRRRDECVFTSTQTSPAAGSTSTHCWSLWPFLFLSVEDPQQFCETRITLTRSDFSERQSGSITPVTSVLMTCMYLCLLLLCRV